MIIKPIGNGMYSCFHRRTFSTGYGYSRKEAIGDCIQQMQGAKIIH